MSLHRALFLIGWHSRLVFEIASSNLGLYTANLIEDFRCFYHLAKKVTQRCPYTCHNCLLLYPFTHTYAQGRITKKTWIARYQNTNAIVPSHPTIKQQISVYKHSTLHSINKWQPCFEARNTSLWILAGNMSITQSVLRHWAIYCLLLTACTCTKYAQRLGLIFRIIQSHFHNRIPDYLELYF